MHLVTFYFFALHGLECTGAHVERQFLAVDTFFVKGFQYSFGEMESGGRSRYRAFDFGIYRLVGLLVAFLRLAVQVRWDWKFAYRFQYIGKSQTVIVPFEVNPMAGSSTFPTGSTERNGLSLHLDTTLQGTFLPFLQIAHHA